MEPRERMLVEVVAGAALIIFLVLASVMVVSAYKNPETTITNSYNTYTYTNPVPSYSSMMRYSTLRMKPYVVDRSNYARPYYRDDSRYNIREDYRDNARYTKSDDRVYYNRDDSRYRKSYSDDRYLRYDDFGNFRTYEGIVGNKVNNYEVYVRNRDYAGGYFKTIFYFEDYYGNVDSESMTNYIPAREEKRFILKDVSPSRYDYRRWWYEVKPLTRAPTKSYFYENY